MKRRTSCWGICLMIDCQGSPKMQTVIANSICTDECLMGIAIILSFFLFFSVAPVDLAFAPRWCSISAWSSTMPCSARSSKTIVVRPCSMCTSSMWSGCPHRMPLYCLILGMCWPAVVSHWACAPLACTIILFLITFFLAVGGPCSTRSLFSVAPKQFINSQEWEVGNPAWWDSNCSLDSFLLWRAWIHHWSSHSLPLQLFSL